MFQYKINIDTIHDAIQKIDNHDEFYDELNKINQMFQVKDDEINDVKQVYDESVVNDTNNETNNKNEFDNQQDFEKIEKLDFLHSEAFDENELQIIKEKEKQLQNNQNAIIFELDLVNEKYEEVLNNFEIDKAYSFKENIAQLKDKLQNNRDEFLNLNKEIKEKEEHFLIEKDKFNDEIQNTEDFDPEKLQAMTQKYGNKIDQYKVDLLYQTALNYLKDKDENDTEKILSSNNLVELLGDKNIQKMVQELKEYRENI